MKEKEQIMEMLLAVIGEEYPKMTESKKAKLANIVFNLIQLLNDSRIEESVDLLYENYKSVRML